jgi:threonine dehydrogenase-like Zn-dependent dehydrogenase
MKALLLEGAGRLRPADVADPAPEPNEAVIRVHACSVCGSDLHAFHGKHPRLTFPRILGHEFAGEIVEAPRGSAFRAGDRVCCDIDIACGVCRPCRDGRSNLCEQLRTTGFDRDGAYAEFVAVPGYNLHRLPDNVGYDQASAVQVLGVSYHAVVDRVKPRTGEKVAVIGAGPIGLGVALIAQHLGADVSILDLLDYRRAMARDLGVAHALDPGEGRLRERALELTDGGFDKVVECVGGRQEQTIQDAVALVRRGGQITVVGTFPDNRVAIPIAWLKDREIDVNFSRGNFRAFEPCLELIASGRVDPSRYISHRFPLARAEQALAMLAARDVEAHKIVLHPQDATVA